MTLHCAIVICTKNRREDLIITLQSVFHQSLLPDTMIIVDDSASDETKKSLEKVPVPDKIHLQFIHPGHPHTGLTAARNTGIRHIPASTDIVLFLDDDVTLEESYLETIRDLFQKDPGLWGVTGYIRNRYHGRSFPVKLLLLMSGWLIPALVPVSLFGPRVTWTAEALYPLCRKPRADTVPAQWLSGCNMAYRSAVFVEGFTFDECLVRYAQGEDVLFSHGLYRDGKKLLLSYNAHITHRISVDDRISPVRKLAMIFGYRNYEISRFVHGRVSGSFSYTVFVIQYILSAAILSVRNKQGLASVHEVVRAYGMTREFEQEIRSGHLERFNDFLSSLP
jgi:glycosyltransferase involved in cell wall biosynthesis